MTTTWAVTYAATCASCGTHVSLSGAGIPDDHRPAITKFEEPLEDYECFCGAPMVMPVVGITRDPYVVKRPDDEVEGEGS